MNLAPYCGKLVRLAVYNPATDAATLARWNNNVEYQRLGNLGPAFLPSARQVEEWYEKHLEEQVTFFIHTLADDRVIGGLEFSLPDAACNSWIGIGIGEREDWGKGYGTEAMRLALDFAFREMNLNRVSLSVYEFNPRAVRSYEKAGFQHEGRQCQAILHGARRWDMLYMGILRSEWENARSAPI
jgi:RimJ/RimL family protein N-acetyltransferase